MSRAGVPQVGLVNLRAEALRLRPVAAGDEDFLLRLFCAVALEELGAQHWDPATREALLRQQFHAHEHHYRTMLSDIDDRLVLLDGAAIGRLIVLRTESSMQLADITLLPENRNHGIGTNLLRELQEQAEHKGHSLRLNVRQYSRALRLYERLGFVRISDTETHCLMEWGLSETSPGLTDTE